MFYGKLISDNFIILTDEKNGKKIVDSEKPEAPEGYIAEDKFVETPTSIIQIWNIVPIEGTAEQAALALSKLQFRSLPDDAAYEFRALADDWIPGQSYYGPDDPSGILQSRVKRNGKLYKCLQTHVSQDDWTPEAAPSLWAEILPGQEGNEPEEGYAEWEQPGAMNGYSTGDKVLHNGHLWESTQDDNVWEPGAVGAPWNDLGVYPPEEG